MNPIAINVTKAAALIGVSKSRLYELVAEGAVPARKIGTRTVFYVPDLDKFVRELPTIESRKAEGDLVIR